MRRPLYALALTTGVASALAFAGAASADASGTPVTFTVNGAGLSITQPSATASLGTATAGLTGTSVTGSIGSTTITDLRASLAGWTSTVAGPSGGFLDGSSPADVVAVGNAVVWVPSLTVTPTAASAVRTDLHLAQATGVTLSGSAQTLVSATTTGSNAATFNPGIAVTIPAGTIAGTYTGTVTQTVS